MRMKFCGTFKFLKFERLIILSNQIIPNPDLLKYDSDCQTQLIYSLIIIRLATCFDPTGSSSGLSFEATVIRKLRTFLGSQTMFAKDECERSLSSDLHYVKNMHCI